MDNSVLFIACGLLLAVRFLMPSYRQWIFTRHHLPVIQVLELIKVKSYMAILKHPVMFSSVDHINLPVKVFLCFNWGFSLLSIHHSVPEENLHVFGFIPFYIGRRENKTGFTTGLKACGPVELYIQSVQKLACQFCIHPNKGEIPSFWIILCRKCICHAWILVVFHFIDYNH